MIDYKLDLNTGVVIEREILENIVYLCRNQDKSITINERKHADKELEKLGYVKVVLEDKYLDYKAEDFNEDLTFSVEKYNARKEKEKETKYQDMIVAKIRKKYTINQELAILRQATTKPEEYQEYFDYVEQCKVEVKSELNSQFSCQK